jgi:receptor expression-enhancing protein 5/6
MLGIGASYITCLIGVAYPAFMSFLALESGQESETTQWLTYWVVFGLFNIVDQFAGFILHFIPFYYFLKLGFLVFLFHPSFKGATYVYENYLKEAVKPVE